MTPEVNHLPAEAIPPRRRRGGGVQIGDWESELRLADRARRQAEASLSVAARRRADLVRDARAAGYSWGVIARVLGCSRTRVVQIVGDVSAEPAAIRPLPDSLPALGPRP